MALPPLGNPDDVVVSVYIEVQTNGKQDAPFHCVEMFHGRISLNSVPLLLLVNFVSGFRLKLMYIFLIVSIRSNLSHLHGFQELVLPS